MGIAKFCQEKDYEISNAEFNAIYLYCDKAKDILLSWAVDYDNNDTLGDFLINKGVESNLSPIEQIFYVAFHYSLSVHKEFDKYNNWTDTSFIDELMYLLESQKKIVIDKNYIVDFIIDFTTKNENGSPIFKIPLDLKYAIELDGFNYHSNKKQMNYDYERENKLKKIGYNVIRFTGSQIYNHPMETINDLLEIIKRDIDKELGNGRKR